MSASKHSPTPLTQPLCPAVCPAPRLGGRVFIHLAALCLAALLFLPGEAMAAQNFRIKGFSLGGTDKQLEVHLQLGVTEEYNLSYMLRDGAKMELSCRVELLRKRSFWSNELLAETEVYFRLSYDLLLRDFVLASESEPPVRNDNFHSLLSETWNDLVILLDNPTGLAANEDYLIKATVELKHSEMPPWLTRSILFWSDVIIPATTFELDLAY